MISKITSSNDKLINEYLDFRLNPATEKLVMTKISESRARRIKFNLEKISKEINKNFIKVTETDAEVFFQKVLSGDLKKSKRIQVEGDIPILKQKVPYSKSAYLNFNSDFKNFWKFLIHKYDVTNIFLYIKKP